MNSKMQKNIFFVTLIIYSLTLLVLNCTIRMDEVKDLMNLTSEIPENAIMGAIIIGSLVTILMLAVILILARFLLQIAFKIIYKDNKDRSLLNEVYFVPLTIKIFFLIVLQFIMVAGFNVKPIWISLTAIISYCVYIFVFKGRNDVEKNNNRVFEIITGIVLIFAL